MARWIIVLLSCTIVIVGCNTIEIQSREGATVTNSTVLAVEMDGDPIGLMSTLRDELVFRGYHIVNMDRLETMEMDERTSGLSESLLIVDTATIRLHRLDVSSRQNVEYVDIRFYSWPEDELITSVRWRVILGSYRAMPFVAAFLAEKTDDHFLKRNQDR